MKVYLSATYKDLIEHRKAAYQQLRMMRHDVIGMEDYVASDQRPLDKCLDVAQSDVYLGISPGATASCRREAILRSGPSRSSSTGGRRR